MNKTRGIQYFFPIVAPFFLAGANFFVQSLAGGSLLSVENIFSGIGVSILFGCFTIDIWGITSSISKNNTDVTTVFVLLLIIHLFSYAAGVCTDHHIEIMLKTGYIKQYLYWILSSLILFSLGILIAGREYCWRKIEQ